MKNVIKLSLPVLFQVMETCSRSEHIYDGSAVGEYCSIDSSSTLPNNSELALG